MKIEPSLGNPTEDGIYAARQWYGWRILEWHNGEWWHIGRASAWPKKAEIDAFVGPLPVIARDFSVKEDWPGSAELKARGLDAVPMEEWEKQFPDAPSPAAMEFDL